MVPGSLWPPESKTSTTFKRKAFRSTPLGRERTERTDCEIGAKGGPESLPICEGEDEFISLVGRGRIRGMGRTCREGGDQNSKFCQKRLEDS